MYDLGHGILKKMDVDFKACAEEYQSIHRLYSEDVDLIRSRQRDFISEMFVGADRMDATDFFTALMTAQEENFFKPEHVGQLIPKVQVVQGQVELEQVLSLI